MSTVGVISDTHGLLRPQAVAALAGVDHIIHAGDIGSAQIIEQLRQIAPVTAVRGNNDKDSWANAIPETTRLKIAGRLLYVLHDIKELDIDPAAEKISAVIVGHSHKPSAAERNGVLFLNPGSAGPRRFKLPVALAKLFISATGLRAEIIDLEV
jgi:putative phosphoesterase